MDFKRFESLQNYCFWNRYMIDPIQKSVQLETLIFKNMRGGGLFFFVDVFLFFG